LTTGSFGNDGKNLSKVAAETNYYATERTGIVSDILKSPIDSLEDMTMLHYGFIPKQQIGLSN
jgi:hypothetical protein